MTEPTKPTPQPAAGNTSESSPNSPAIAPRRPPGPIRLWGFLLVLASGIPLYFSLVSPYLAAVAQERVSLLGLKLGLLGMLLLVYGLPMLLTGPGFTRLRDRLPQVGKASSLDIGILVLSMLLAYFADHQLRVMLHGMGYPVSTDW